MSIKSLAKKVAKTAKSGLSPVTYIPRTAKKGYKKVTKAIKNSVKDK